AGRYTVREDAPSGNGAAPGAAGSADVLVIQVEGAPPARRRLLRSRVRAAKPGATPAEVPIVVATLVKGTSALAGRADGAALRAGLDLEQGRERAAAVGLRAGLDLLRAELRDQDLSPGARRRLEEAEAGAGELAELASRARDGGFAPGDRARLERAVKRLGGV